MKIMKRMAAFLLCLSLLIGIPCAVQAVDVGSKMRLLSAYALTDRFNIDSNYMENKVASMSNYGVALYLNDSVGPTFSDVIKGDTVKLWIEAYNAEKSIATVEAHFLSPSLYAKAASWAPKTTGNVVAVGLGTWSEDGTTFIPNDKGFYEYMTEEATNFRLYVQNNTEERDLDHIIEGFPSAYNGTWLLHGAESWTSPDDRTDDTICVEIIFASRNGSAIKNISALNNELKVESLIQRSSSTYWVKFNKEVKIKTDQISVQLQSITGMTYLNANGEPYSGSEKSMDPAQAATAKSVTVLNDKHWVEVVFDETDANTVINASGINDVFLAITDNPAKIAGAPKNDNGDKLGVFDALGVQNYNGLIDGIWTEHNGKINGVWNYEPLVKTCGKNRSDNGDIIYLDVSDKADDVFPAAWIGNTLYNDAVTALNAAESGNTVVLGQDATVGDHFLEVPAGVTLDLNGKNLTVANIFSFGDIIDLTDGEGGLVVSNNKTQAFVGLQETNTYFPLYDYDNDRYRFYEYEVHSTTPKTLGDTTVKFGTKIIFHQLKAYELLQNDGALTLDIQIGENGTIPYKFNTKTMKTVYNTLAEEGNWEKRTGFAVALNIYGLDNLADGTEITVTPYLRSAGVVGTDDPMLHTT